MQLTQTSKLKFDRYNLFNMLKTPMLFYTLCAHSKKHLYTHWEWLSEKQVRKITCEYYKLTFINSEKISPIRACKDSLPMVHKIFSNQLL